MIAHLKGTLSLRSVEDIVIDVGGVGYAVQMTSRDLNSIGEVGGDVFVHIFTHFRDGAISLFGFLDESTRSVFSRLIAINGVGPKLGLAVLSTLSVEELWDAAHSGNSIGLRRVPGVGPKKARRLTPELKDMFAKLDVPIKTGISPSTPRPASGAKTVGPAAVTSSAASVWNDVRSALQNLGYSEFKVEETLTNMRREGLVGSFDELLREALARR